MSVPAQIATLLVLTARLFDPVPIERMTETERAVQEAAATIPAEIVERVATANKLSDGDREAIIPGRARLLVDRFCLSEDAVDCDPELRVIDLDD